MTSLSRTRITPTFISRTSNMRRHNAASDSALDLKALNKNSNGHDIGPLPALRAKYGKSRGKTSPRIRASYDSAADLHGVETSSTWNTSTQKFVAYSTFPLLLLLAPQLWMNYTNLRAGNAVALAALSWMVSFRYFLIIYCVPS